MAAETANMVMSIGGVVDKKVDLEFRWSTESAEDADRVTITFTVDSASRDHAGATVPFHDLDVAAADGSATVRVHLVPGGHRVHLGDGQASEDWVVRATVGGGDEQYGHALIEWSYERKGTARLETCTIVDMGGVEHDLEPVVVEGAYEDEARALEEKKEHEEHEQSDELASLAEMAKSVDLDARDGLFARKHSEALDEDQGNEDQGDEELGAEEMGDGEENDGGDDGQDESSEEGGEKLGGLLALTELRNHVLEDALVTLNEIHGTDHLADIIRELEALDLTPEGEGGTATTEQIEEAIRLLVEFDPEAEAQLEELEEVVADVPLKSISRLVEVFELERLSIDGDDVKNVLVALNALNQKDEETDRIGRGLLQATMKLDSNDLRSLVEMARGVDPTSLELSREEQEDEDYGRLGGLVQIKNRTLRRALTALRRVHVDDSLDDLIGEMKADLDGGKEQSTEEREYGEDEVNHALERLASFDHEAESKLEELEEVVADLPLATLDRMVEVIDLEPLSLDETQVKRVMKALKKLNQDDEGVDEIGRKLLQASMQLKVDDLRCLVDLAKGVDLSTLDGIQEEEEEDEDEDDEDQPDDDQLDGLRAGASSVDMAALDRLDALTRDDWDNQLEDIAKENYRRINALHNGGALDIVCCGQYILFGEWEDKYAKALSASLSTDQLYPAGAGTTETGLVAVEKGSGVFDKGRLLFTGIAEGANREAIRAHVALNSKKDCQFQ